MTLLGPAFIQHALIAGIPISVAAGLAGYFLVLRGQVFTADALSHVAFTGALAALAFGLEPVLGLFAATIGAGAALGLLGGRGRIGDVTIGAAFAWILGLGVLALSLYSSSRRASTNGSAGVRVLFGSIFGLDLGSALEFAFVSLVVIAALLFLGRPLLFASIDASVAAARGLPVRGLGVAFLAAVGATAGIATQAVGALLILGLLSAPAGAARRLTTRPYRAMAISAGLGAGSTTAGIAISEAVASVPPSFAILAVATGCYLIAAIASRTWDAAAATQRA